MASKGDQKRRAIRDAATKVFAESGFNDARVSDIAREAGVAHGLVYHYYDSKEALLDEVFQGTWKQLNRGLATIEESGASAMTMLESFIRLMLGSYLIAPDLVRVVILEVTRSRNLREQVGEITAMFERIEGMIELGQRNGEFRTDIKARILSYIFWGAVDEVLSGWVMGTLPSGDSDVAEAEEAIVKVVLAGLASGGASASPALSSQTS